MRDIGGHLLIALAAFNLLGAILVAIRKGATFNR